MRSWLCVVVAISASACALSASRPALIDLTSATIVDSNDGVGDSFSMTVLSGTTPALPPLRLEIIRLDQTRYRRFDPVVYDVRVTNTSSQPQMFPISASPIAHRDRPATGYRSASFSLVLVTAEGREVTLDYYTLFGAPTRRGSVRTLDPGESVVFRIPTMLRVPDPAMPSDHILQMPASVRAKIQLLGLVYSDPQTATIQPMVSSAPLDSPIEVVNPVVAPLAPYREPPVVQAISPALASPGSSIDLVGLRFGVDRPPSPIVTFVSTNGEVQRRVRNGSAAYEATDRSGEPQILSVYIPEDLPPGTWHVVIEQDGRRGQAVPFEVGEWVGPIVERLTRTTVNPGTFLEVIGSNFREGDRFELTDARGVVHGWTSASSAFEVPQNVAPGDATLQITARGPRGEAVSRKLTMTVTTIPLPLDWVVMHMRSVAPSQWTRLALRSQPASGWWERIDVEFSQGTRKRVVELHPSDEERLRVPSDLHAGEVTLRARVVHGPDASPWSEPQRYAIASRPVPPTLDLVEVGPTQQSFYLSPGPDKPNEFLAQPGDRLRIGGDFPMSRDVGVDVTFESAGARRRVTASRDPIGSLVVHTPSDLAAGVWKIVVSVRGLPPVLLPVSMRVEARR